MKLHREPSKKSILRSAMTTFTMDRESWTPSQSTNNYVVSNFYISRKNSVPLQPSVLLLFLSLSFFLLSLFFSFFSNRELLKNRRAGKSLEAAT